MLTRDQIIQLSQREEFQKNDAPIYIWVMGLSGAGKTFVLEHLKEELQKRGTVGVFSDGAQLLQEVRKDTSQKYHIKDGEGFLVTNTAIDDRVYRELVIKAEAFKGDFFLIEVTRGKDVEGERDLSFSRLFRSIPKHLLSNSVFIYVHCPYEERVRRNQLRTGNMSPGGNYRKVNPVAMRRFFQEDDFEEWKLTIQRPIIELDNSREAGE